MCVFSMFTYTSFKKGHNVECKTIVTQQFTLPFNHLLIYVSTNRYLNTL